MAYSTDLSMRSQRVVVSLRQVVEAAEAVDSAKRCHDAPGLAGAKADLLDAARSAYDNGASWQTIADALGIRRGNAYQRFRRHS